MNDDFNMTISLPVGEDGMIGRQCSECHTYFKLKPGTGLTDIETTACPYCEFQGESEEFHTAAQIEYAKSIAVNRVVGPALLDLKRSFKKLERFSRGSMIRFKFKSSGFSLPVKYYSELDLETTVECDNCSLLFAVYGVFAVCPDCLRPNSMSMFKKSMVVARKRLAILENIPADEGDLQEGILIDSISAAVSTFDSLGKRLRQEYPEILPSKPRNLFQNIEALEFALRDSIGLNLQSMIGETNYIALNYMFQVRNIWIHNFGEADQDFIKKTKSPSSILGEKVVPIKSEVEMLFDVVEKIGLEVRKQLGDSV